MHKPVPILALVAALPTYSRSELILLKNKINAALTDTREKRQGVEQEDWLLYGLLSELRRTGIIINDNFRLKSAQSFRNFEARSVDVRLMLEDQVPNLTATEKLALGQFVGKALLTYLVSNGKALSLDTTLENVHLIPRALNREYPDYLECGMFDMIVRRVISGAK